MNVTADSPTGVIPLAGVRSAAGWYRLTVYVTCTLFAIALSCRLGKEMAWDVLNYHLYAGFSALHDRFAQDYFAAGPQGYFNPYAYVPFYLLATSGLPAIVAASILAAVHSMVLWLTYELALVVCAGGSAARRTAFSACAVAFAALNPILLQQIGTSFTDITTGELVLAGWLLLATAVRAPAAWRIIAAGALLGIATALKLTNAVHAVSAVALLLFLPLPLRRRTRLGVAYGASLGLGFALVTAPWAYRVYQTFGNPFFPLLNTVFRSPDFTTEPLHHLRFVPSSLSEALWRPFAMLNPMTMVHEELMAPDSRYALLVVLTGLLLIFRLRKPVVRAAAMAPMADPAIDRRVLAALGCGLTLDWVAWLTGSGNSRYFLPLACVAAVLVVALVFEVFGRWPKVRNYVLAAIFTTQVLQLWWGTEFRWCATPWQGPWFDLTVPESMTKEPALYLMAEIRSSSFLAPFLPRESGWIDIATSYPLEGTGASGRRVQALIQRYAPHVRLLISGEHLYRDGEKRVPTVEGVNSTLQRFGLRIDTSDCSTFRLLGISVDWQIVSSDAVSTDKPPALPMLSCRLVPDHTDHSADLALERMANVVLDRVEDACPELFQPRRVPTGRYSRMWRRIYLNTDLIAWVSRGEVKFFDPVRGDDIVHLGPESDWARAPRRLICGRRDGHYFASVLSSEGNAR